MKDTIGPLAVDTMIQEHQDAGTLEPISQRTQTILCILRKADIVFPIPPDYVFGFNPNTNYLPVT